ncbi:hypothetical protein RND71_012897 [Anisodus tanguticus]|uniref:Uncharacterized protein n=1 Tax=Anisodus tanguticus TaxID=243964 RepID=A0AAE1SFI6_9SOLA|nr:hypothetical protein RND71_012897 [Anisodus tanguticus]
MARSYGVGDGGSTLEGTGLMIMVAMVVISVLMISMVIFACGDSSKSEKDDDWYYRGGGGTGGDGGGGCGGGCVASVATTKILKTGIGGDISCSQSRKLLKVLASEV